MDRPPAGNSNSSPSGVYPALQEFLQVGTVAMRVPSKLRVALILGSTRTEGVPRPTNLGR